MSRYFKNYFLFTVLLTLVSADFAAAKSDQETASKFKITVRVFNYAKVSNPALRKAIREATQIFQQAGVETVWRDHTPCLDGRKDPACHQPESPLFVNIHFLPRSMSQRLALRSTTFGLALPARGGGFGKITYLFYDRIEKECERKGSLPEHVILGHIMAHEMGHLFLGHGSHSGKGIMRFPWHKADLERASRGGLLFTSREAKRIRAQVLERTRAEEDQQRAQLESAPSRAQANPEPKVKSLGNNFAAANGRSHGIAYGD